jgi:hypothetical protein
MSSAQLATQRLSLRGDPPRVLSGRVGPVSQPGDPIDLISRNPRVDCLAGHAIPLGHLDNRRARQHFNHGTLSLLGHVRLPRHEWERRPSNGATVPHFKRSRARRMPATCDNFLHGFKGTPSARQAGPGHGRGQGRGSHQAESRAGATGTGRARTGSRGPRLLRGGSLPRPTGGSPPGAALPPVGCPAPQAAGTASNAPPVTAPARPDRAALPAPGILSPRNITVKGAPKGASLRADP